VLESATWPPILQKHLPVAAGYNSGTRARAIGELEELRHLGNGSPAGAIGEGVVPDRGPVSAADALDPDVSTAVFRLKGRADARAQSALRNSSDSQLSGTVWSTHQVAALGGPASKDEDDGRAGTAVLEVVTSVASQLTSFNDISRSQLHGGKGGTKASEEGDGGRELHGGGSGREKMDEQ
jgi:hypothetical protein